MKSNQILFQRAPAKLSIASLDGPIDLVVEAQYNPKELQLTQPIGWTDHVSTTGQNKDVVTEFGGAKPQTLQLELLFDGYETGGVAGKFTVAQHIARLKQLATVRSPSSDKEDERRPHYCLITWGERGLPALRCVIENLTTKYLMFSPFGQALRAMCTVNVKEVDMAAIAKEQRNREERKNTINRRRGV
jgi:hypothetical protein